MTRDTEHPNHVFSPREVGEMETRLANVRGEVFLWTIRNQQSHYRCVALSIVAEALEGLIRLGPQPVNQATMAEKAHLLEILDVAYRCLRN